MESFSYTREALPLLGMITVEFAGIGLGVLSKSAMRSGLNRYVYIVYYDSIATLILLPWFVFRCLSGKILPITSSLICRFFILGLIGKCLLPICFYTGLSYSSVTLGAAISNLSPIFTSMLAMCFRMEKLDLRKLTDQIKVSGIIVSVSGALIVTLYKGPALLTSSQDSSSSGHPTLFSEQSNWPLGCLLFILGSALGSFWGILQADTAKSYPDETTIVFFLTLFGTVQTYAASLFFVEGQSEWQIHHKIDVIAILYAAILISVLSKTVITWCLHKKGPIYVSMFSPLGVAIAAAMGFVFLQDGIYLGSAIGAITIVVGFYAVMWAQAKKKHDMVNKNTSTRAMESASSYVTPLLQNPLS